MRFPMQFPQLRLNLQQWAITRLSELSNRRDDRRPKPKPNHLRVGERGELEALFFLRSQGFQVVERRWRTPDLNGDLDLIAWEGETLCVVEVKTRSARELTPALSAVTPTKRRMLGRMGRAYRRTLPRETRHDIVMRFDVISVYLLPAGIEFELLRNVFDAQGDDFDG